MRLIMKDTSQTMVSPHMLAAVLILPRPYFGTCSRVKTDVGVQCFEE